MNIDSLKSLNPKEVVVEFRTNRIFILPFLWLGMEMDDTEYTVRGTISEEKHKLTEGYKITCVPDSGSFAVRNFYMLDFLKMIEDGKARILPNFIDYGIGT